MASAEHEPITGVWAQSPQRGQEVSGAKPPEAESILVIGCPTEPANLAPVRENSMFCYGTLVSELKGPIVHGAPQPRHWGAGGPPGSAAYDIFNISAFAYSGICFDCFYVHSISLCCVTYELHFSGPGKTIGLCAMCTSMVSGRTKRRHLQGNILRLTIPKKSPFSRPTFWLVICICIVSLLVNAEKYKRVLL